MEKIEEIEEKCEKCNEKMEYLYDLVTDEAITNPWCFLCLLFSNLDLFDKKIIETMYLGRCIMCEEVGSSEQNIIGNIGGVYEVRFNICSQNCFYDSLKHYSRRITINRDYL